MGMVNIRNIRMKRRGEISVKRGTKGKTTKRKEAKRGIPRIKASVYDSEIRRKIRGRERIIIKNPKVLMRSLLKECPEREIKSPREKITLEKMKLMTSSVMDRLTTATLHKGKLIAAVQKGKATKAGIRKAKGKVREETTLGVSTKTQRGGDKTTRTHTRTKGRRKVKGKTRKILEIQGERELKVGVTLT